MQQHERHMEVVARNSKAPKRAALFGALETLTVCLRLELAFVVS